MDSDVQKKVYSLKSLTSDEVISLTGPNEYIIGLTAEEKLSSSQRWAEENDICLPLFSVTIWQTDGCTFAPSTKDLPCKVNDEEVNQETNLLPGSKIEMGDKLLEFVDGPVARQRRQLPATPGVFVQSVPPNKPKRSPENKPSPEKVKCSNIMDEKGIDEVLVVSEEERLSGEWCIAHPPTMEEELINQLHTPDQIANLSASYLNRQIHLFTDTKLNHILVDQIFKTFQDVAVHRRDILERFLRDFSQELTATPDEQKGKPFHTPIIHLLVEILKQFLDPMSHVVLCLQLLRAISHLENNLYPLVHHQATAAILGSMTAYLNVVDVQQHSLDILVKIATYKPEISEKPPLHEGGIEVISLSIQHHFKNLNIVQSGCRVLSNVSTSLYETASQIIDDGCECHGEVLEGLDRFIGVLDCVSWSCTSIIQEAMKNFSTDLGVTMEGRRFLYVHARVPQLKQRKSHWYEQSLENDLNKQLNDEERDDAVDGILKRSRSYETLRTPERKVQFEQEDEFLSSCASTVSDASTVEPSALDEDSVEICSRVYFDPETGKQIDEESLAKLTQQTRESLEIGDYNPKNGLTSAKEGAKGGKIKEINFEKLSNTDLKLLTKLLKAVIVCQVCSHAFDGEEAKALKLIDKPIKDLLTCDDYKPPSGLLVFVNGQLQKQVTLMDIDPSVAISTLDAVRYRSVGYEMVQSLLKSVVKSLDGNTDLSVVYVCCRSMSDWILNEKLQPAFADEKFCEEMKKLLLSVSSRLPPGSPVDELLTHIINLHIKVQQISPNTD